MPEAGGPEAERGQRLAAPLLAVPSGFSMTDLRRSLVGLELGLEVYGGGQTILPDG